MTSSVSIHGRLPPHTHHSHLHRLNLPGHPRHPGKPADTQADTSAADRLRCRSRPTLHPAMNVVLSYMYLVRTYSGVSVPRARRRAGVACVRVRARSGMKLIMRS